MDWKLIDCDEKEWTQDESGHYTIVNNIGPKTVRLDLMTTSDMPVISFEGTAENVRKHAMAYADKNALNVSLEHASYIGRELARAELLGPEYVQS
jgi:hypothetical protein